MCSGCQSTGFEYTRGTPTVNIKQTKITHFPLFCKRRNESQSYFIVSTAHVQDIQRTETASLSDLRWNSVNIHLNLNLYSNESTNEYRSTKKKKKVIRSCFLQCFLCFTITISISAKHFIKQVHLDVFF